MAQMKHIKSDQLRNIPNHWKRRRRSNMTLEIHTGRWANPGLLGILLRCQIMLWAEITAVYDSWWPRRNFWWPSHALYRHSQDSSARRSTHTAKIWVFILCIPQDLSSRRFPKRPVQRCCSGVLRILSGHHHFFWSLWIQQEASIRCWCKPVIGLPRWGYVNLALALL